MTLNAANALNLAHYVEQGTKRLKLGTVDHTPFNPGAIIKIRLENFVTYSLAEFDLSPSLNMIIGPNGSGKSTFVCAVCLGLAGKPEYIKRSKRVEEFIKNGEERGSIEITLKNSPVVERIEAVDREDDVIKITRILTKTKSKSEYFINDKPVTESVVKLLISQLNIQLDNLCQFLSQERVEEFARLRSDKLLAETVRSVDSKLINMLELLKELQNKELNVQKELELNKQRFDELTVEKDKLTESVRVYQELEDKKKEIELHSQLLPYVKIKNHKQKLQAYTRDYEEARNNLKSMLKDKKPFNDAKRVFEEKLEEIVHKRDVKDKQLKEDQRDHGKLGEQLETLREDIERKRQQNEYYRNRTKKLESSIAKRKKDLEEKRETLKNIQLPSSQLFDELAGQRKELIIKEANLKDAILELDNKASGITHDMRNLEKQMETRLKYLNGNDRIGILDQSPDLREVKNAVLYIRSRPEMRGKILEPPIMSVSAKAPSFAPYLAQCVDYNTSKAFTIVDSDSYEQFSDEILKRYKVNLRELNNDDIRSPVSREDLRNLGFESYLSDFVTGDKRVIEMLCQFCKIHTIPVSRKELTSSQLTRLSNPSKNGSSLFKRIIHGNRVVDFKRSLYGARQFFSIDANIKETPFYQQSVMSEEQKSRIQEEISQLKLKYAAKRQKLDESSKTKSNYKRDLTENSFKSDSLAQRVHSLNEVRRNHSLIKTSIESLEVEIRQLLHESKKDVTQKIKHVESEISTQLLNQTKLVREMISHIIKLNQHQKELAEVDIAHVEAQNMDISMAEVLGSFADKEAKLKEDYHNKKKVAKEMRNTEEYRNWMQQIRSYDAETREKLNDRAEEYEKDGNFHLPFIQDIVDRLESEIGMHNHDESSITILSQVERELKQLHKRLPRLVEELKDIKEQIKERRLTLEPKLDEIVSNISKRFSILFKNVGSAGAVNLEKPHLFSEWKIEIMVKFRDNAALKKLDSHTQSGGERAVSTVLYMIALQESATAPFRVVDEINQGMDSRNERIVHKAMVENACAENTSQYFLITPKLLTELYYHEKMRIHCVMAGSWMPNPTKRSEMVHFGQTSNYVF